MSGYINIRGKLILGMFSRRMADSSWNTLYKIFCW